LEEKKGKGKSPQLSDHISQMANDQSRLRDETKNVADKLPDPDSNQTDPATYAKTHLNQAQSAQQSAIENMRVENLSEAAPHQETALNELKQALESLEKGNGQSGRQNENPDQQGQSQNAQQESGWRENQNSSSDGQKNEQFQHQQDQQDQRQDAEKWISGNKDDVQGILDEEKENQKHRLPESSGGYREVDRDW
jgi:hypothetical protein